MKKIIAIGLLVVMLAGLAPAPAQAGAAVSVALGLASFAVFNQLAFGLLAAPAWAGAYYGGPYAYGAPYYGGYYYAGYYPPVAYAPPPVTYYAPPVAYAQPAAVAAPVQNQVVYPQGRYLLRGDGVTTAYQWVWIPNPPPAPPTR
jgi:hypothetical protein